MNENDDKLNGYFKEARSLIADLAVDLAFMRLELALKAFDPNQPRWPAGQSDGGQWRPANGNGKPHDVQVAGQVKRRLIPLCKEQMASDEDACRASQSQLCWTLVMPRYNACIRGEYVPELLHWLEP